jgi:ankyrin repeat protein
LVIIFILLTGRVLSIGKGPNCRAAEVGDLEITQILLDHDADIDALNYMKQTPFHVAAAKDF